VDPGLQESDSPDRYPNTTTSGLVVTGHSSLESAVPDSWINEGSVCICAITKCGGRSAVYYESSLCECIDRALIVGSKIMIIAFLQKWVTNKKDVPDSEQRNLEVVTEHNHGKRTNEGTLQLHQRF
jgi:hypothetical protein